MFPVAVCLHSIEGLQLYTPCCSSQSSSQGGQRMLSSVNFLPKCSNRCLEYWHTAPKLPWNVPAYPLWRTRAALYRTPIGTTADLTCARVHALKTCGTLILVGQVPDLTTQLPHNIWFRFLYRCNRRSSLYKMHILLFAYLQPFQR